MFLVTAPVVDEVWSECASPLSQEEKEFSMMAEKCSVWRLMIDIQHFNCSRCKSWVVTCFLASALIFSSCSTTNCKQGLETKWLAGFSMSKWAILGEANKARIQSKGLFETVMSSYLIFIRLCTVTQWKDLANCCTLTKVYSQLLYSFSWGIYVEIYKYKLNAS